MNLGPYGGGRSSSHGLHPGVILCYQGIGLWGVQKGVAVDAFHGHMDLIGERTGWFPIRLIFETRKEWCSMPSPSSKSTDSTRCGVGDCVAGGLWSLYPLEGAVWEVTLQSR